MSSESVTNIPRDRNLDRAWESQSHLQSLPRFRWTKVWKFVGVSAGIALLLLAASFLPDTPQTYRVESEARVGAE